MRLRFYSECPLEWAVGINVRMIKPGRATKRTRTLPEDELTEAELGQICDRYWYDEEEEEGKDIVEEFALLMDEGHEFAELPDPYPEPAIRGGGVYIVRGRADGQPAGCYIGQSNRLKGRLTDHWASGREWITRNPRCPRCG